MPASPLSPLHALFSQIYSRAARSRLTQTFCRQRRDVTYARRLLRSERFPPPALQDNLVPLAAATLNLTDELAKNRKDFVFYHTSKKKKKDFCYYDAVFLTN